MLIIFILILMTITATNVYIYKCRKHKKTQTFLILTTFYNNYQIKIQTMKLKPNEFVDSILQLVDKAQNPVTGATFSNIVLTSSDEAVFTTNTDVNSDGQVDIVGVAIGTADLNVTCDVSYTDPSTGDSVSTSKTATVNITVAASANPDDTTLVVSFTDAAAVPTV